MGEKPACRDISAQNYKFLLINVSVPFAVYQKNHTFVSLKNMEARMEFLLHYVWKHRQLGTTILQTRDGEAVEVIDPGVHNLLHAGPDFFNAKVRIGGVLWAGNVEVHDRSSDWYRHHHHEDPAYNNVVLHVVSKADVEVQTCDGKRLPQLELQVPQTLQDNYQELLSEETYPPCYRVIPQLDMMTVHAWMSRLTVERLEQKCSRIRRYLEQTSGNWERCLFIALARSFGFSTNAQAFEQWAQTVDPQAIGKHRDDEFQVEAFFMGQAGLLDEALVAPECRDAYFLKLQSEYAFLRHKFGLTPVSAALWKFGRLRPQNFPHVRIAQLAKLYTTRRANFSRLLESRTVPALHELFRVGVTDYWRTHYTFGMPGREGDKILQQSSLNLLIINTAVPVLFAYARDRMDEEMAELSFSLLESLPPEKNYITRCWSRAGIAVESAADSQALIQLRTAYCDRKDCLRCRFGMEYLKRARE